MRTTTSSPYAGRSIGLTLHRPTTERRPPPASDDAIFDDSVDGAPACNTSPDLRERPSCPPNLARRYVLRLPNTGATSMPPAIPMYARQPVSARPNRRVVARSAQ